MNKIYFTIDTSKCGFPILKTPQDNWNMSISTIVHNYVSYRFKLNRNIILSNKSFRTQLLRVLNTSWSFSNSKNSSHVLKALIISLIQNQGHDYSVHKIGYKTAVIDIITKGVYLSGSIPNGNYNYFFQIINTSHANFFNVKIHDPKYSLPDEQLKNAIQLNKSNFIDNIEQLKHNPISIISNKYEIDILYDQNEKEEKLILDNIEIYSKDHLKISIKEKLKGIEFNENFAPSKYNIYLDNGYVFNTWSGSLVQLDETNLLKLRNNELNSFSSDEKENLKDVGILTKISNEFDAVRLQNRNYIANDKKFSIVIAPTTKCNASCSYCFEKGINAVEMDDNTINNVVNYIEKASKGRKVHITWFGGEPLMGAEQIDKICTILDNRKIQYYSSMISNGYFVDKYIASAKKWKLGRIQITIDDLFGKYDLIKKMGGNSFEKVINNIHLLIDNDIKVSIRVNFDASDYQNSLKIIDYVKNEFGDNVNLYFHDIVGEDYKSANEIHPNPMIEISKKLMDAGYIKSLPDLKIKRTMTPCGIEKANYINVFPDGSATKCEHFIGKESEYSLGNLNDSLFCPKAYQKILYEGCKHCICYPICGGGCDSNHKIRKGYGCTRIKTGLIELLKLYINYLERKNQK